ncbi:hypothetical protein Chor_015226 [Crotalus horridus]
MADEDLIFHMEYLDNATPTKPGCGNCHEVDSDEEENYYICPITDDPVLSKAAGDKVNNYYSNLVKNECYSSSSFPRNSFQIRNGTQHPPKRNAQADHGREAWKHAIEKAKHMPDPWAEFHLENIKMENATRYRKKLSNFLHMKNWKGAFNYVAKRYIETVNRDVYFEDVRLQMEAKLWGEEYNRHKPPKQVDIVQTCIIEMKNRPGRPLYHLEHYIEGKYIKYNSNSGFVRDDNIRLTPQAFSHFTFERSGHQLIIVDIQGVGDLYTDPQIHTESGTDFGDGNLVDNLVHKDHEGLDNQRDSENGGDSGCPSEKRSDHEDMDHREKCHLNCNRRHESDEDSLGSSARCSAAVKIVKKLIEKKDGEDVKEQDWKEALFWYDKALNMTDYDEGGEYDGTQDEPRYLLLAKEAEMLMTGGFNLDQDLQRSGELYTEAAEDAMQAMKGRLANQYYQKAEEVWAMMEE